MRILGVDPGSRLTGFGCVDFAEGRLSHVVNGTLRLANTGGRAVIALERRLLSIHDGLTEVIREYRPQVLVVEKVFFAKNAVSALKLGQARGAVILTGMLQGLEIVEYSPSEVKLAVASHGQADKEQVARMVQILLGAQGPLQFATSDASDAIALAICHAHATRGSGAPAAMPKRRGKKKLSMAEALGLE